MKNDRVQKVDRIWLSTREATAYLGMSRSYLEGLRNEGLLPYYKVKGAVFYRKSDIDRLIERNRMT